MAVQITAAMQNQIAQNYIAIQGRNPDPAGFSFWTKQLADANNTAAAQIAVVNGFGDSTEFRQTYAGLTTSAAITLLYQNVLLRAPDAGGLAYWTGIANGLIASGQSVTNAYAQTAASIIYNASTNNSSDSASVNARTAAAVTAGTTATPITYTLTTGPDNFLGGSGNDLFNGTITDVSGAQTFQSWDTIDGGTGTNTLNAQTNTNFAGTQVLTPTLANIQRLNLQDIGTGAVTLNLLNLSTLTNMQLSGNGASGYTINGLGSTPSIVLDGTNGANTLQFTASALAPVAQNLAITLNAVGVGGGGLLTVSRATTGTLEALTLNSTGSANTLTGLTTSGIGATVLTVTGDQNLTIGAMTDTNTTLTTVDASAFTGNLSVTALSGSTVTGGSGNDSITSAGGNDLFVGGSGNDVFTEGAFLTTADTITGGLGTDTLSATVATVAGLTAVTAYSTITGVETLTISDAAGGNTITTAFVSADINRVNLDLAIGGAVTLAMPTGAMTVALRAPLGSTIAGQTLTVTSAGTATTDVLTFGSLPATATAIDYIGGGNLTTTGFETVAITTGTFTGLAMTAQTLGALNVGAANAVTVTGTNTLTLAGGLVATSLDASGLTGTAVLNMTGAATTITSITGTARADVIVGDSSSTIDAGAGNDNITGGTGNDTILAGDGADTITGNGGVDSILGGAGNDTVTTTLATGNVIDGGADTDTLSLAVAATAATGAGVRNFEILTDTAGITQDMVLFTDNGLNTWNRINVAGAVTGTYTNVGSGVTTLGLTVTGGTLGGFTRLVDTATDALTINVLAGATLVSATANTENTISVVASTAAGAATITTLADTQLATLNIGTAASSTGAYSIATVTAAALATVNVNTTGTVNIGGTANSSVVNMTVNASSASAATVTGGTGADVITGGAGADSLTGGAGSDTIVGGAGVDTITGGTAADRITTGTGADRVVQGVTDSVVASATSFAGGTVAAGDTLTFAVASGVDVITDFTAGTGGDVLDTAAVTVATAATTLIGATTTALTASTNFFASGTYNSSTGIFTIAAAGTGTDTAIISTTAAAGSLDLTTNQSTIILVGVNSANLVAANFI